MIDWRVRPARVAARLVLQLTHNYAIAIALIAVVVMLVTRR